MSAILILVMNIMINTGCKKDNSSSTSLQDPSSSSLQQLSQDDAQVQISDNQITNDVDNYLISDDDKSIGDHIIPFSCDATVDTTSHGDTIVYTFVYNGFNGFHDFHRSGTVIIEKLKGVHWMDPGAFVMIKYVNLKIGHLFSGKTFTYNGMRMYKDVTGGIIKNLGSSLTSIEFQMVGSMQITFENGTTKTWNISRTKTWGGTYPDQLTVTYTGNGYAGGYNNLSLWGADRNGETFYAQIITPIMYSESCHWYPIWGVFVYQVPGIPKSATVTYGYDSSHQLVSEGNMCRLLQVRLGDKNKERHRLF